MSISTNDMIQLTELIEQLCGLTLDTTKAYLIESRLGQVAKEAKCDNYVELCQRAIRGDRLLRTKVVDAITTHETLFFRDGSPFETLQHHVIPELMRTKGDSPLTRRIRVWSAACSTGQEPYSIAMVLLEALPNIANWDVSVLGTDIADSAIAQAKVGRYTDYEIGRGMPQSKLAKFFNREGDAWCVNAKVRALVRFEQRNLLDRLNDLGPFDVIFCRNVAIYFAPDVRRKLFETLASRLTPGGFLFVGSSESLADIGPAFAPKMYGRSVFYQPNGTGIAAVS